MAHSAIMSVRITGNADDAVKAFEKTTTKAAAFGSAIGGDVKSKNTNDLSFAVTNVAHAAYEGK